MRAQSACPAELLMDGKRDDCGVLQLLLRALFCALVKTTTLLFLVTLQRLLFYSFGSRNVPGHDPFFAVRQQFRSLTPRTRDPG